MYETGDSLSRCAEMAVSLVDQSCKDFKRYTESLRAEGLKFDKTVQSQVEKVIECFETSLSGCLVWSLVSARYGAAKDVQEDGSLLIKFN